MPDSHLPLPGPDYEPAFLDVTKASHAPGGLYSDPAVLQRELTNIFHQDWLLLGRTEELPNPGDYRSFRIGREPVLMCRDKAGALRAYANMCLHRGVEVATGAGNQRAFVCPYHGWSYGLDGRLIGASWMQDSEGFDKRDCRLREYPLNEWQGWVFVSLAREPMPFAEYLADFEEKFGWVGMQDLRVGLRTDTKLNCNWKFMVENFIDFYHLKILHKGTIGRFLTTPDATYDLRPRGQVYIDEYDAGPLSKDGQAFADSMPSMKDKPDRFSRCAVLPPNVNAFLRRGYMTLYTSWPVTPDTMVLTGYALWPKAVMESPEKDRIIAEFQVMLNKVLEEDFEMVESLQNAAAAASFVPGRMSRLERGVQHFIKHSIQRIA